MARQLKGTAGMDLIPTVSVLAVRPVADYLARIGVARSDYMARLGIEEDLLDVDDARVPIYRLISMWRAAQALAHDPEVGLHIAAASDFDAFGFASAIAKVSPTIGDAFRSVTRYARFIAGMPVYALEVTGDTALLRLVHPRWVPVERAANEFLLALPHLYSIRASTRSWSPIEVSFAHARPASTSEHARIFGCPVRFGADVSGIRFPTNLLESPLHGRDDRMAAMLDDVHVELAQNITGDFLGDVGITAWKLLQDGDTSLDSLASSLAMSARSLQRKLALEGTSHREVLDQVRSMVAERMLSEDVGLLDVALTLGFSDQTAFQKAFRRWSGTSPRVWRVRQRSVEPRTPL